MSARRIVVTIVALGTAATACSSGGGSSPGAARATTTAAAKAPGAAWSVYGHDLANSRLNPLEHAINPRTVAKLRVRWSTKGQVGVTGTPIVAGGVVYYDDWTGTVHAAAAATGKPIWQTAVGGTYIASP